MAKIEKDTYLDQDKRWENLDFLRGVFIFLALYQHFTVYLSYWFVDYFKEASFVNSLFPQFESYIGVRLPADSLAVGFAWFFTAWVSQVYLTLAAFNLSKRSQEQFKKTLRDKLKIFGLIYLFFLFESFLVAPNLGLALSFSPIMAWMLILLLLSLFYAYLGTKSVFVLLFLSLFRWLLPAHFNPSLDLEIWVQEWIHPGFEYDARIEYFFTSGCLGFLLGRFYYGFKDWQRYQHLLVFVGILLCLPWVFLGAPYHIDAFNIFETEHDLAESFLGSLYIYGAQLILIPTFIWLQFKGFIFKVPFFHWVGVYSILVFGFHRIFMVHVGGPLWAYFIGAVLEQEPANKSYYSWLLIAICVVMCWFARKTKIAQLITRS